MKSLLYFLIVSTNCVALCQPIKLDINFFYKCAKVEANNIEVKSILLINTNEMATLKCGPRGDFVLSFNIQEQNALEANEEVVKVEIEIFDNTKLIGKPVMIMSYNERAIIETFSEVSELSLSIIASKEELQTLDS